MSKCQRCGNEVAEGSVFCHMCGSAIRSSDTAKLRSHVLMVLSITLGVLGFDRFYNRQVGWGVLKLITLGGLGIWWLVDAFYYTFKAGESSSK